MNHRVLLIQVRSEEEDENERKKDEEKRAFQRTSRLENVPILEKERRQRGGQD